MDEVADLRLVRPADLLADDAHLADGRSGAIEDEPQAVTVARVALELAAEPVLGIHA